MWIKDEYRNFGKFSINNNAKSILIIYHFIKILLLLKEIDDYKNILYNLLIFDKKKCINIINFMQISDILYNKH